MADAFWEKYKHPNWQRKRLEIMQRANFACERCLDADTILNVHHNYYEKGVDPWDYPNETLRCLCEPCHVIEHDLMREIQRSMAMLSGYQRQILPSLFKSMYAKSRYSSRNRTTVAASNHYEIQGIAMAFDLRAEDVENAFCGRTEIDAGELRIVKRASDQEFMTFCGIELAASTG